MRYARIAAGLVVEVAEFSAPPVMHPSLAWVPDPGGLAQEGGAFLDGGFTAPTLSLDEARNAKRVAIEAAYAARLATGFTPTSGPGAGKAFDLDDVSQTRVGNLATRAGLVVLGVAGATWPGDGQRFVTMDYSDVMFTAAEFVPFADSFATTVSAIILHHESLVVAVLGAADAPAIAAIDPTVGWP